MLKKQLSGRKSKRKCACNSFFSRKNHAAHPDQDKNKQITPFTYPLKNEKLRNPVLDNGTRTPTHVSFNLKKYFYVTNFKHTWAPDKKWLRVSRITYQKAFQCHRPKFKVFWPCHWLKLVVGLVVREEIVYSY